MTRAAEVIWSILWTIKCASQTGLRVPAPEALWTMRPTVARSLSELIPVVCGRL